MSYGIRSINSSGFTQIDGTYDNLSVFASGTATAGTTNTYYPVAFPANTPSSYVIFAKPSTESGDHLVWFSEFTNVTTYASFVFGLDYLATSNISVDWVIAIKSSDMPANNSGDYGLEVNKTNGDQAFSSNNGNFRCQQVAFDDFTSVGATGTIFSLTSMAGVYSIMSGKSFVGRQTVGSQPQTSAVWALHSRWDYTNRTIRAQNAVIAIVGSYGVTYGGGFRTNLIGTFA